MRFSASRFPPIVAFTASRTVLSEYKLDATFNVEFVTFKSFVDISLPTLTVESVIVVSAPPRFSAIFTLEPSIFTSAIASRVLSTEKFEFSIFTLPLPSAPSTPMLDTEWKSAF